MHDALAKAVPDRVPAEGANSTTGFFLVHARPEGGMAIHLDVLGGVWGAARGYDAIHCTDHVLSSCRLTPVESIEQLHPHVLIDAFGLIEGSWGAGVYNGGLGMMRRYRILRDDVTLSLYSDRFHLPPRGRSSGGDGALARLTVEREGETIKLGASSTFPLRRGDLVEIRLPGGGGWGSPGKRDPLRVKEDVEDGLEFPTNGEATVQLDGADPVDRRTPEHHRSFSARGTKLAA